MIEYDYLYKIVLVGDSGVGKTNISSRFTRDSFSSENKSTIGVEFANRIVMSQDKIIKAQIWDTAGQERYRTITQAYYRGSVGVIFVYDITKRESFSNLQYWIQEIKNNGAEETIKILVGNKSDLAPLRQISTTEGQLFAQNHEMFFIETSALDGNNIEAAFEKIIEMIHDRYKIDILHNDRKINLITKQIELSDIEVSKKSCQC